MNTTPQDTFDTLTHGYIPITELLEHAKTERFNLDQFEYDDIDESYRYGQIFSLLWDGDFYYIDCYIQPPDPDYDERPYLTVSFYSGICLDSEEQRYFPPFRDHQLEFSIHSRQDFIDALNQWEEFVHVFYGIMFSHRIEILEDVDKIVKSEKNRYIEYDNKKVYPMKKSNKKDYIKWMNQFPTMIADEIQKVINFEKVKVEEVDCEPIYLSDGIWMDPITGKMYSD